MAGARSNLKTRDISVPFISNPFGLTDGEGGATFEELGYVPSPEANLYLDGPYTLPSEMNVTELYLTARLTAPDTQDLAFRVAVGRWDHDYIPVVKTAYTEYEIIKSQRLINGVDTKFECPAGETILLDGLNLVKALPSPGSDDYKGDAFVLLFMFDEAPDFVTDDTGSFEVKVNGSALLGVK